MPIYIPPHFQTSDRSLAEDVMRRFEFATVVTAGEGGPWITHVPLVLDAGGDVLRGHVARANGQTGSLEGGRASAVFHGPHAYVSPTWYDEDPAVPTWNYIVVHATGPTRHLGRDEAAAHLDEVFARYEGTGVASLPADWFDSKLRGIVAFELQIETLECKAKMSQNKSWEDRKRVVERLRERGQGDDSAVAEFVAALGEGQ